MRTTRPVRRNATPTRLFIGRITQLPLACRDLAGDGLVGVGADAHPAAA